METQLEKRMQQVKELFTDCTDVFEELIAVKTHLAEKIEECQSAVENMQSSLSKADASQAEAQIQVHSFWFKVHMKQKAKCCLPLHIHRFPVQTVRWGGSISTECVICSPLCS